MARALCATGMRVALAVGAVVMVSSAGWAQERVADKPAEKMEKAGRPVALPMTLQDGTGNIWTVQMNGMVMQQNNNGLAGFGQMGNLIVNGMGIPMRMVNPGMPGGGVSARLDDKTGELTLSNLAVGGFLITRRIWIDKENGYVRFVDSLKNTGNAEATASVMYSSTINYGIQQSKVVQGDAKKRGTPIGWSGQTNGRGVFGVWGYTGGKATPKVVAQENMNAVQSTVALTVPADGEVAIVNVQGSADSMDRASAMLDEIKLAKLLSGLPGDVRRMLANVPAQTGGLMLGVELLRGEQTDVIETISGDLLRGTLTDKTFALKTKYGRVELPAEKLVGLATMGRQQPMQLLITDEGEIFGGELEGDGVSLQLASGQTVKVSLAQFSRAGYHRKATEVSEGGGGEIKALQKPWVALRSGERIAVATTAEPVAFASRYGLLSIPAEKIASVMLRPEESNVHIISLTDGSRFSGFLTSPELKVTLDGAGGKAAGATSLTVSDLVLFCPSAPAKDNGDGPGATSGAEAAELRAGGADVFYGALTGKLQLDTPYQLIDVAGDGVKSIRRVEGSRTDVKVVMWDGSSMTGMVRGMALPMKLVCGVEVSVPVDLLTSYENGKPRPSASMGDKVKALVAKLNDEDFKAREAAQKELIAAGPVIAPLLKEMREGQPLEAQQRVDQVLAAFEKQ